ncbi:NAD-dependent protein deacylase-like isoform X2 [Macrosteles quadrilineatus]|uniref:NAD-dependent protein deacylase-like isoform X2 n=1 Tax=Macrosteles quadrilineatus TaxID=74068 RepID=UPI0023E19CDA|nr:NAD-dependent protein deacylase-like isoform X2 [Macrosteles quadrilineatus]
MFRGSVLCLYVLFQTVLSIFPPSNDTEGFRTLLREAKHLVVITGAGISRGVPAYSEAWGPWRNFYATDLDNDYTFENLPFLVWQFTHYRRESILKAGPNAAHKVLADYEEHLRTEGKGRNLTIITTNFDGLHIQAGSQNVIEVCGSLFKTRCLKCGKVLENRNQPMWPSLAGKGDPNAHDYTQVEEDVLPHCECGGRLRPHILFQGESISKQVIYQAEDVLRVADLCMVIGSSGELAPVDEFAPTLAGRGVPVAELNLLNTDLTIYYQYQFKGDCVEILPHIIQPLL